MPQCLWRPPEEPGHLRKQAQLRRGSLPHRTTTRKRREKKCCKTLLFMWHGPPPLTPSRMEQRTRDGINLRPTALTRRRRSGMRRVLATAACMPEHRWLACGASSVKKTPANGRMSRGDYSCVQTRQLMTASIIDIFIVKIRLSLYQI